MMIITYQCNVLTADTNWHPTTHINPYVDHVGNLAMPPNPPIIQHSNPQTVAQDWWYTNCCFDKAAFIDTYVANAF